MTVTEFEQKVGASMPESKRIGVALSGGADSVALLAALTANGFNCIALHCNFHLREEESNRDQHFAEHISSELGVECRVKHFDVAARCNITGESVEMACRELRYEWFREEASLCNLDVIAVGHHSDDRIETFFLNLFRSTGLRGLSALRRERDIFMRPMLQLSRRDILRYLSERNLHYITDSSNLSDQYLRNRIRNHIMPTILEQFRDADSRILTTMDHLAATDELLRSLIRRQAEKYILPDGSINLKLLVDSEPQAAQFLFEMLRLIYPSEALSLTDTENVIVNIKRSGRRFGLWINDRGILRIVPSSNCETDYSITPETWPFDFDILPISNFKPERDPTVAWFDESLLSDSPTFELRPWQHADRMQPFGLKGTRAVSDIFNDLKLSVSDKSKVRILTRNNSIIWIPGIKNSALFSVRKDSIRVVRLRLKKN